MENMKSLFSRVFTGKRLVVSILCFALLAITTTVAAYELTKMTVTVVLDGEEMMVKSHEATVEELLQRQGVYVEEHDLVEPSATTLIEEDMKIIWKPAREVDLIIDGEIETLWTTEDTVEDILKEQNVRISEFDEVSHDLDSELDDQMQIMIDQAFQVQLISDGEELDVWTTSITVADLLQQEDIILDELDRVEPGLEAWIDEEQDIKVVRVEKVIDVVEERIYFQEIKRNDKTLEKGKSKVVQQGEEGTLAKHYEVILENDKEVSRDLVKEEVVKEKVDRVVAIGTKEPPPVVTSRSGSSSTKVSSGQTLRVTATAYTAECSGCSGYTATGINLKANPNIKVIAVDPNVIPLGTRVHVQGYGEAIAGDTGGNIRGNKIDIHVPTRSEAFRWGRRTVTVTILGK